MLAAMLTLGSFASCGAKHIFQSGEPHPLALASDNSDSTGDVPAFAGRDRTGLTQEDSASAAADAKLWNLASPDGQPMAVSVPKQGAKLVALTFDDGPDNVYTPAILDILRKHQIKATFFVVGKQTSQYGSVLKRIVQEGHAVGNHSYSHSDLTKMSDADIQEEVLETDMRIREAVGFTPRLFRAPYGAVDDRIKSGLEASGRNIIGWTVDTRDWAGASVKSMRANVVAHTKPNGIILMHSFGGKSISHTVELLPQIIGDLRKKGFTFVTIPDLEAAKK